ncbi:MAG: sensor histidine kinase [Caulobacteraceae bacterium]
MTVPPAEGRWWSATIRVRLALALAVALAPVLILGAVQSTLNFRLEERDRNAALVGAAERSTASARARIAAAEVLLQTLAPGSVGLECAMRLADIKGRIPGYVNLIRFDAAGRVACAAASVPPDPGRAVRPWFRALASGGRMVVTTAPGAIYADQPALLAGVRANEPDGRFGGALTAIISLASLRPERVDRALPVTSEVALADGAGRYLSTTLASAFPVSLGGHLMGAARDRASLWLQRDRAGDWRVFTSAPLVGRNVYAVLSAPSEGVVLWARLNPVTSILLPLLAFTLALAAVWTVADRGIVRWIGYLQRIASIYARGRYSVHPLMAHTAPPEIRGLAETLDGMAQTIAARDTVLRDSLVEKDALMREIHHRVKNNLQVISSLLNMQQRALTDPAARAAMSDTRQRISALALIYRSLYQGPDLKRVDLRDFLDELIAQLIVGETGAGAPIETALDIDPIIIDPDRLAPLALFAVEAISNAKKHGIGDGGGRLAVRFQVAGALAELAITDSGAMREGSPEVGTGVGRTLMTAFARQLRGEVTFCANRDGGLTARLVFPTPDIAATGHSRADPRPWAGVSKPTG